MTEIDVPPDEKTRLPWKRILLGMAVLVGVILLIAFRDIDEPHFPEFEQSWVELGPTENPVEDLSKMAAVAIPKEMWEALRDPSLKFPADEVVNLYKKHGPELAQWEGALEKPQWQCQKEIDFSTVMPYLNPWMNLMKLKVCEARRLADEGEVEASLQEVLEVVESSHRIESADGALLLHNLVAITVGAIGRDQVAKLVASGLTEEELKELLLELQSIEPDPVQFAECFYREYNGFANTLGGMKSGKLSPGTVLGGGASTFGGGKVQSFLLRPNRTKKNYGEAMREAYRASASPHPVLFSYPPEVQRILDRHWSAYVSANAFGNFILVSALPSYDGISDRHRIEVAKHRLLVLQIAFQIHRNRTGKDPGRLADLVPNELPSVPLDPFTGKEMLFDPATSTIWSVGEDKTDSGGVSSDPDWSAFGGKDEPNLKLK